MDDDWQEAAFNSRHIHNRVGRNSGRGKRFAAFDVQHSLGTYTLDARSLQRRCDNTSMKSATTNKKPNDSTLEVFRLTNNGDGLLGSIDIPTVLECTVVLAGSRKALQAITEEVDEQLEPLHMSRKASDELIQETYQVKDDISSSEADDDIDEEVELSASDNLEPSDIAERRRFQAFEKNSFRAPKFWMAWRGRRMDSSSADRAEEAFGSGYLVFSGNDCRKFRGTISCENAGWDNVSFSGWKAVPRSARDTAVCWRQGI
ncbi:hypothetical protein F5Y16DRAFT_9651 [Xylariaceae sp. FL0255]|nr:hypothetical protein F5Y16DRAFT_9651 [Xylariaceae sp. FL0255]